MAESPPFERLRPAGLLERFLMAKHALGLFKNVGVSATYWLPKGAIALEPLIYRALGGLIAEHPILTAIPVDEDSLAPYYVRIPQIDLRRCVTFVSRKSKLKREHVLSDAELDEILEQEHNRDFKETPRESPFWRVTVLHGSQNFTVAFVFHHAVSDGTSGLAFHRHLLLAIEETLLAEDNNDSHHLESHYIVNSPKEPLIPAVESLHNLPLSREYVLRVSRKENRPNPSAKVWTGRECPESSSIPQCRFQSFTISPMTTRKLLAASRANSTTITGLTDAVIAATLFAHLPSEYDALRSDGAISFRRHLPVDVVDDNSMGTWTSRYVVNHYRAISENHAHPSTALELFSWEEARRIRKTIEEVLGKNGADSSVGLLRYVSDYIELNKKKTGKARAESFESSNIGVFRQIDTTEVCSVGRMVFSQSADAVGAAFEASLVTGGDGGLTIGLSWHEGSIESEWMYKVIETLRATLEDLAKSPRGMASD